ncbi:hypothetical protein PFICI_10350 [Pestalotiopsis fici W106-1]|uniref:Copper acquisition factor BIM1-like domain-containing protein n=1 Tax=Pestalotiopsis fici (strain W106-1 / CGMCC3.15140) TaxID=1229662 RepID=W3WWN6_PESFW|nr:uncharacterized protein PFICI_10350 [Pestalotiopsis fici W106-1]ETS78288.1 hypothetical protein PFICI_10350 [Pestalotiopsis fici W106-1]
MASYPTYYLLTVMVLAAVVQSHLHIIYPGSRGENLVINGTVAETNGLSIGLANGTDNPIYPYGMQWQYPCGGLPVGQNRTSWPVRGNGILSFQMGLQAGHSKALLYVNMGLGSLPPNHSLVMVPVFNIDGPTNAEYHDSICLDHVPLPANVTVNPGDNATIQIVQAAKHGAALYNCVDVTFVDNLETPSLDSIGCSNSTGIHFSAVSTNAPRRWGWYNYGQMIGLGLGLGLPLFIAVVVLSCLLARARKQLRTREKLPG